MEDPERGYTSSASVHMTDDGKFEVTAMGGYDGFLREQFDQIEDALDFIAGMWQCDTTTNHYQRRMVERGTGLRTLKSLIS